MADSQASGTEKKQDKRFFVVLFLGMTVIVALLGVIVFLLLGRRTTTEVVRESVEMNQRAVVVNEDNIEEVVDEVINQPATPMGYYEVSMNFTWNFTDGVSPSSNAYVENVVANSSDVYFDVVLADDESVALYESPILPRGTHINEVTLSQDLEAGTYPCVIIYHLVDDQQRTTSTLRMNMTIVVEN